MRSGLDQLSHAGVHCSSYLDRMWRNLMVRGSITGIVRSSLDRLSHGRTESFLCPLFCLVAIFMDCVTCRGHSAAHVGQKGFPVLFIDCKSPQVADDLQRLMLQPSVHRAPNPLSAGSTSCTQACLDLPVASLQVSILWMSARFSGSASSPLVSTDEARLSSSSETSGSAV